jgi:uncharacterized integral membrane protein (TIGR00698 family)
MPQSAIAPLRRHAPGVLLCAGVSLAAWGAEAAERALAGRAWLEAIVLSILIGTAVRTAWTPGARWRPGIALSAKQLLEAAVVLLGLTLDVPLLLRAGPALLVGVVGAVAAALAGGYSLARLLGLRPRLAVLVACGNAICGNSAIAAVAPVVGAESEDVASSIAFTAVLGVLVVLGLPLLVAPLALSTYQYGVLAGLTVYAVPQVLAATLPVSALSGQVGTLVKLVRVLMLGPVVLGLSLVRGRRGGEAGAADETSAVADPALTARRPRLVPWFILGFVGLALLRATGVVPATLVSPVAAASRALTVLSMAALGLGVDVRVLRRVGGAVTAAAAGCLLLLLGVSLALLRGLHIG